MNYPSIQQAISGILDDWELKLTQKKALPVVVIGFDEDESVHVAINDDAFSPRFIANMLTQVAATILAEAEKAERAN